MWRFACLGAPLVSYDDEEEKGEELKDEVFLERFIKKLMIV